MSTWNPASYLKFERERTLPCRDLVSKIEINATSQIADLGCGPGNSTAVIAERWPEAEIVGVDNSPEMLKAARESGIAAEWELSDIRKWNPRVLFDLVFSNAALQWIPDHEKEIPRLFSFVARGGALAFQIPTHTDLWYNILEELLHSSKWSGRFRDASSDFYSNELGFYYDLLSPRSKQLDLWETEYYHVLSNPENIVEWTKGTALRPLLDRLPNSESRSAFLAEYSEAISKAYPKQPDGAALFPFLRRFVVAYAK